MPSPVVLSDYGHRVGTGNLDIEVLDFRRRDFEETSSSEPEPELSSIIIRVTAR
jgi:hypothetical protein